MSGYWKTNTAKIGGLVFTRKVGERIIINNGELVIEVVATKGRYVRLAFVASREISIQREERLNLPADPPRPVEKKT